MNSNHPPASIWGPICDRKQGNNYCWPKVLPRLTDTIYVSCSFYFGHAPALAKYVELDSKQNIGDLFMKW